LFNTLQQKNKISAAHEATGKNTENKGKIKTVVPSFDPPSITTVNWNVPWTYPERTRNVLAYLRTFLVYAQRIYWTLQLTMIYLGRQH